ncbi:MAG: tetratricopeptide repeat protein [Deltaproteobacteria bacterium]|nr:tetratricopeptide repeat protein [Deltaproteobacteria bacterium]
MIRILALFALLFAMTPRIALADDPATRASKRHFDRGEKLFALGKFDEALDEYQKAFDAKPIPDFLFNIGQCYRNLGDYQQAIFSFKKYLKLEPDASDKEKVEKLIDELEEKQERGEGQRLVGKTEKEPPPPPPPAAESTPFYKKWWFWTGVAVVGAGTGVGVYEATKGGAPGTTLGNITFTK